MKYVHLDAARGIASVVVLASHYFLAFMPEFYIGFPDTLPGRFLSWTMNGTGAVAFFFVLSGFVLTRKYFQSGDSRLLWRGAVKRYPRLYLSCAISIFAGYALLQLGLYHNGAAAELTGSGWLGRLGAARLDSSVTADTPDAIRQTFLVLLQRDNSYYNVNLWTMFYEFWGSLAVFALAGLLLFAGQRGHLMVAGVAVVAIFALGQATPFVTDGHLVFLLGGSLILGAAVAYCDTRDIRLPLVLAWPAVVSGLLLCSQGNLGLDLTGGALVLVGLVALNPVPAIMKGRMAAWLGELSFPLYLMHTVVLLSLSCWVYVSVVGLGGAAPMANLAALAALLMGSVLACIPLMRLERWWIAALGRQVRKIV